MKYSNSICDLLIINLHHPLLIIIMMYRPPSCPAIEFNDIILKAKSYILSLPSPLPNSIMLGDINLPNIDWSCPDIDCPIASPLTDLASLLFLNQQVNEPTRKHNIFALMNLLTMLPLQTHFYLTIALLMSVHVFQYPRILFKLKV